MTRQAERLVEYGVSERDIYEDLEDCLGSLREGDTLVVYTPAIFGRNKINTAFTTACQRGAVGIYSLSAEEFKGRFYDCQLAAGMEALSDAWEELESVTKRNIAEIGKQKGGRKQGGVWKHAEEIRKARNEGVTWKELSEVYKTSEATLRRILR